MARSKTRGPSSGSSPSVPAALALSQELREISVSEFFTKNRHLLGFDNPTKALLTIPDRNVRVQLARRFHQRRTPIKAIVASCQRTIKLLEEQAKPKKRVPITRAALIPPSPTRSEQRENLCPDCTDHINQLAEEFCNDCVNGLSEKCLHCPGVMEFINGLLKHTGAINGHR